ncbi:MAG TPA: tRNA pseudouridine(38-40) synthase TruA [Bacillales bacterium]|nr:tRNA pseudouridine(38-40) synthase TruA [Bacillales bacterium]
MASRLKCELAYDGTEFSGWQIQPSGRTVQGVVESALKQIHKGREVRINGSGRTDAGVHANGQVFHFDTDLSIPEGNWQKALNAVLPKDVRVKSVQRAEPDFHARFDVVTKEYRYRVLRSTEPDVFRRFYTAQIPYSLDVKAIKQAASHLVGTHDFSSFCAANTDVKNKVRTLKTLEITEQADELVFRFVGNGFLYHMVRIVVGTLLQTGNGKLTAKDVSQILEAKDRTKAGPTAPGNGLFLWQVTY